MSKVRWLDRTLVMMPCYLGLCTSEKAFKKELKRLKVTEKVSYLKADDAGRLYTFERSTHTNLLCLVCINPKKGRSKEEIYGLLVHEAVHVWQAIKENIEETSPSPEFEAYSIQSISQVLMEAYRKDQNK